ncbi:hypothetical protein F5883DRAFT_722200 [Diaporthe sp. PMI_573]|nr:hypothetical protein F5883DRAFT_722200 [Diaporthaceae sp. PMI_573]
MLSRPLTQALYSKLAARPESEENGNFELLCGSDDFLDKCDAQPEECEEALLSESNDDSGLSSASEPDSDTSTEPADEAESQAPEDDDLGFDLEYFGPKRGRKFQMSVDRRDSEQEVKDYNKQAADADGLSQKLLELLFEVDNGSTLSGVDIYNVKFKPAKTHKFSWYGRDDDSDASSSEAECAAADTKPEWEGPQLQPKALQCVLDFFLSNPHVKRKACEDFCVREYCENMSSPYGTGPYEVGPHWRRPHNEGRQLGVSAYPSDFQFHDSYMVWIEDQRDLEASSEAGVDHTRMTLFYFTFEVLDEGQLDALRSVYGDLVPDYAYVGHMSLLPEYRQLFVWRIECPAGIPFSTDAAYLGLQKNCGKYTSILGDFVDIVAAPLGSDGGGSIDAQNWPEALYCPRIIADNIIIRPDNSGMLLATKIH